MALQPLRGMHDLLGDEVRRFRQITDRFRDIAERYCYTEIVTPIIEAAEVYDRTLGETSDIVTKETYSFTDRGGESVTVRPEATAGVARAFISGGMSQEIPCKHYSYGPMFRYERPQKGRFRQFFQLNLELIGVAEAAADVEVIAVAHDLLVELGIREEAALELNTLGDKSSRTAWRDALVAYFSDVRDELSDESKLRLERNPLRILDSKNRSDRALIENAPLNLDFLNQGSIDFFGEVKEGLDSLGIAYTLNNTLVRGLDYYCHTAFEFTTNKLGAQNALIAGGRYDGLIGMMGGPETPGIGWGSGIDRLALLMTESPEDSRPLAVVPSGAAMHTAAASLAHELRLAGFAVDLAYRGNVRRRMQRANKLNAAAAIIVGEDEHTRDSVTVRNLDTGDQEEIRTEDLIAKLSSYR